MELKNINDSALPAPAAVNKVHPYDVELDDKTTLFEEMLNTCSQCGGRDSNNDSNDDDSDDDSDEDDKEGIKDLSAVGVEEGRIVERGRLSGGRADDSGVDSSVEEVYTD